MSFEEWLDKLDSHFIMVTGLDRDSWPDQDYWDMFDNEYTPMEALAAAIENEYGGEGIRAFGLEDYV